MEHTTPISDKLEREIEAGTRDVPQRVWHQMHAFERDLAALKAQRDELLAALKSAAASLEQLVSINRIPANNAGLRDATAALSKHKEASHG